MDSTPIVFGGKKVLRRFYEKPLQFNHDLLARRVADRKTNQNGSTAFAACDTSVLIEMSRVKQALKGCPKVLLELILLFLLPVCPHALAELLTSLGSRNESGLTHLIVRGLSDSVFSGLEEYGADAALDSLICWLKAARTVHLPGEERCPSHWRNQSARHALNQALICCCVNGDFEVLNCFDAGDYFSLWFHDHEDREELLGLIAKQGRVDALRRMGDFSLLQFDCVGDVFKHLVRPVVNGSLGSATASQRVTVMRDYLVPKLLELFGHDCINDHKCLPMGWHWLRNSNLDMVRFLVEDLRFWSESSGLWARWAHSRSAFQWCLCENQFATLDFLHSRFRFEWDPALCSDQVSLSTLAKKWLRRTFSLSKRSVCSGAISSSFVPKQQ